MLAMLITSSSLSAIDSVSENIKQEWKLILSESAQSSPTLCEHMPLKDRYSDVRPLVSNKFIFTNDPLRYINASHVKFDSCMRKFIQCQAPMRNSLKDHWWMIWESMATTSLVLTKFYEGMREKCFPYWPKASQNNDGKIEIGELSISHSGSKISKVNEYDVEIFKFTLKKGDEIREHEIIHFLDWPDNGYLDAQIFLELALLLKNIHDNMEIPLIVHCSAGIGRAGSFITLLSLIDALDQNMSISVPARVIELRKQRVGSVQNIFQYKSIVKALEIYSKSPSS